MMCFAVRSAQGEIHTSYGTNMVQQFPEGTMLTGFCVNGQWFDATDPTAADGADFLVIELSGVRDAIKRGAPPLWKGKVPALRLASTDAA